MAMTVGAQGNGVVNRVFAAIRESDAVMHLEVWRTVACPVERSKRVTAFAVPLRSLEHGCRDIGVSPEATS